MTETEFPPYRVDCYLRGHHVAVEADGRGHKFGGDTERDQFLWSKYQLPVLHITEKDLQDLPTLIPRIDRFLLLWTETSEQRRKIANSNEGFLC